MIKINITFKFIGAGYNNYHQASIKLYDDLNNLVYKGNSYNGELTLCLKRNSIYLIYARLNNIIIKTPILILNQNIFVFNFNQLVNNKSITFLLTDYNYNNLPIMKGEIILG